MITRRLGLVGLAVAVSLGWTGCRPAVQHKVDGEDTPSVVHEIAEQQPASSNLDDNYIPARLLGAETVQEDLGLTADQTGQIEDLVSFSLEEMRELAAIWYEEPAQMTEARTRELVERTMRVARKYGDLQAQVVGMLTPSQRNRLKQKQTQYAIAVALAKPQALGRCDRVLAPRLRTCRPDQPAPGRYCGARGRRQTCSTIAIQAP